MQRALRSLTAAVVMVGLLGTGCPIWLDEGESGGPWVCMYEGCPCEWSTGCGSGLACIRGYCEPVGNCYFEACPDGYVCDESWNCVPRETLACEEDADCPPAYYCDDERDQCVRTGLCRTDADCAVFGASFVCDERGSCVPDRGPCPDGHCGCANDDECRRVGPGGTDWWCESGSCRDPGTLCIYDHECPTGTACLNSFCRVDCSGGAACPTGQTCQGGVCLDAAAGGGECTWSSDCGGGELCVNAFCVTACTTSTACGAFESCVSGMCLPDVPRLAACVPTDCTGDDVCEAGTCREPCVVAANCADNAPFTACFAGYCRTPHETSGNCIRTGDCGSGRCLDGVCR
jgi:hypothetical protein